MIIIKLKINWHKPMNENKDKIQIEWLKKANLLTETLPFMKRYANKVIVVKFGGNAMGKKEYISSFADDIVLLQQVGMLPIVVHGGGPQIGEMLSKLKIKTEFIDGLRVTDSATVDVVEMVLSGVTNKSIVTAISNAGAKAVGISGKDGKLITAKRLVKIDKNSDSNVERAIDLGFVGEPINFYRELRELNPSPYMYYLNMGDYQIVGSSPEILVRLEDDLITVRPIAGTRPRGKNENEDNILENELRNDPKELAEHLMLIDLGRNDAGKVSKVGSIKLTDKMIIEKYSHVMHMVSNVTGSIEKKLGMMDVLKSTFPAGTVSGAPKIRAIDIIYELESIKRGIYAGAIGYLGWNGNMDTAIAIRTCVIKDGKLNIQCGAGIVNDSIAELEWEETLNKGKAIVQAYKNLRNK